MYFMIHQLIPEGRDFCDTSVLSPNNVETLHIQSISAVNTLLYIVWLPWQRWYEIVSFCIALPLANSLDLLATNDPDADEDVEEDTPVYEKFDPLLHRDHGRSKRCSALLSFYYTRTPF